MDPCSEGYKGLPLPAILSILEAFDPKGSQPTLFFGTLSMSVAIPKTHIFS
jgi:hypothetical protein